MENFIEKQLLDADEKLTELVAENKEAATPKAESEVESEVQVKLEPLDEIEVQSVEEEEEAKLQLDDESDKSNVETGNESEEESFESADESSIFLTPTSSRSRSRSRSQSSTPESSPMRPIITSPVPRRQPPPKVDELSETSESSMENEQEEEEDDETFVMKELDVEADDTENKLVNDENDETESKPDSNKNVDATKDEPHEMADAAGEIQEQLEKVEKVAVANEKSESKVEEQVSMKREMLDKQSDGFEKKKKKTSDMDAQFCRESK